MPFSQANSEASDDSEESDDESSSRLSNEYESDSDPGICFSEPRDSNLSSSSKSTVPSDSEDSTVDENHESFEVEFGNDSDGELYDASTPQCSVNANEGFHPINRTLVLFIQMELCDTTLHDWIEETNSQLQPEPYRRISEKILYCLIDLLRGVQFMHRRGTIHR